MSQVTKKIAAKKADLFSSLELPEKRVNFRLRNNTRIRRARLLVSPEEGLVVESPREMDVKRAERLIHRRKTWVLDALEGVAEKHKLAADLKQHKNSVLVFGKEKLVVIRTEQRRDYILETAERIFLGFEKQRTRKAEVASRLEAFFRDKARRYLPVRVRHLNRDQFKVKDVYVKDQRSIWGSCSADGNINLNWRLVMAPRAVGDYIILHELCHTRCLSHSKRFWEHVETVCPNYEKAETWFRDYGFLLHVDVRDWD